MIYGYQIENILDRNIKDIPYEGKEVDKSAIIEEILALIEEDDKRREG